MTKSKLIGIFSEGGNSFETLGFITFWNIRNLEITQEDFAKALRSAGLRDIYSKEHNYRSAYVRAMRNMEEKRLVRRVSEDSLRLVFQFTAETKVGDGAKAKLEYDPETVLVLDKELYRKTGIFEQALIEGRDDIKEKVIKYFYSEKVKFNSSDMTRYIQKILTTEADIIPLRDQGNVYFVPYAFQAVVDKVIELFKLLPEQQGGFESIPLPNVQAGRKRVGDSFVNEIEKLFSSLENEVTVSQEGKTEVSQKWVDERLSKLRNLQRRLELYSEVVDPAKKSSLETNFESVRQALEEPRLLDLDD